MKNLILIIVLIIPLFVLGQNKKDYSGGEFYMVHIDGKTNQEISSIPMGRNVLLSYDTFFKSYSIGYSDQNNTFKYMQFTYYGSDETSYKLMKMKGRDDLIWGAVDNLLDSEGKIMFIALGETKDNKSIMFKIINLHK